MTYGGSWSGASLRSGPTTIPGHGKDYDDDDDDCGGRRRYDSFGSGGGGIGGGV